ncbi:metallo-beta-lactamase domain-containing protein [Neohortaea acidophila]|uniref:Metallo-beta-lactamase domain-containing protein n=1 Tax=Neohortaea acidophila TaxID=245834 RepID=A0A6A6PQ41_9PEZI|nr:metallo-beta-lactamase domain-containing protein [Neohortaea acidophila]KAF2481791.1 metallo-beta-lactamase domain-containing protein [Neohortaea acidophila]
METLPDLPPSTRLSPLVIRILGGNPSKYTLQGTNTYLIGRGAQRILLDTGEGKAIWSQTLRQTLRDEGATVGSVLLSHWHGDHVGGVADVKGLEGCEGVKVYKKVRPDGQQLEIAHGQVFRTEGATLRAFHSPGHTVDHMAFVLEEEDAMFTGDNVLGHGTAVFEDLSAYIESLEGMKGQFAGRAYPGHGEVVEDGRGKIREYIAHRAEREEQVAAVLREDAGKQVGGKGNEEGWRSMGIVKVIYKEYPEHLHAPAEGSVVHVLMKMEADGRVRKNRDGTWSLTKKAAL